MYKSAGLYLIFVVLAFFLAANISASAQISPLLGKLQQNDFEGAVLYLRSIKKLSVFSSEYARFKKIYGDRLYPAVFQEDTLRKNKIRDLERVLPKNPQSRDILYTLYLYYKASGDKEKAQAYLRQAQTIDPTVK